MKQHLAAGTDVNEGDEDGDTPLIYALEEGHKEVAKLLITKGADVNAKRDFAKTSPLDLRLFTISRKSLLYSSPKVQT